MSISAGMEEILQDFITEAGGLLGSVDNTLVVLEKAPGDPQLLNDIVRGFHTIKGGAGFLNVTALVELSLLTENLVDHLRNGKLTLTPVLMDVIMAATGAMRDMFTDLSCAQQPGPAPGKLLARLNAAINSDAAPATPAAQQSAGRGPDWEHLHQPPSGASGNPRNSLQP